MSAFEEYAHELDRMASRLDDKLDRLENATLSDLEDAFDDVRSQFRDLWDAILATQGVKDQIMELDDLLSELTDHLSSLGAYEGCPECPNELNCLINK